MFWQLLKCSKSKCVPHCSTTCFARSNTYMWLFPIFHFQRARHTKHNQETMKCTKCKCAKTHNPVCPAPPTIYSRWPTIRILSMPKHNQHAVSWLTNLSPDTKIQEIKKVQSHAPACVSAREGHTAMTHRHHRLIDSCQRKFKTQPKKYRAGLQCVAQINLEFRPHDSKLFESGVCHLAI